MSRIDVLNSRFEYNFAEYGGGTASLTSNTGPKDELVWRNNQAFGDYSNVQCQEVEVLGVIDLCYSANDSITEYP
jgi:hypothetical protein